MSKRYRVDTILLVATIMLVLIGIIMVYSASSYYALENFHDRNKFLSKSIMWAIFGGLAMTITSIIKYRIYYKQIARIALVIGFLMLIYAILQPETIRGVKRWIYLPMGIAIQPSEFVKGILIIFTAYYLEAYNPLGKGFGGQVVHFGVILLISSLMGGLIFIAPNKSAGLIAIMVPMSMLFVYGFNILLLGATGGIGGFIMLKLAGGDEYSARRLTSFLDPFQDKANKGWQVIQSMYALSLGGVHGVGIGNSMQNKLYIPDVQNDFILGPIGEEFGLIATAGLLLIYVIIIYRCICIAMTAPDIFSSMISVGVGALIFIHVALNYAVSMSLFPVTGVTLPLVSYGGSSSLVFLTLIGVVLNISRYRSVK